MRLLFCVLIATILTTCTPGQASTPTPSPQPPSTAVVPTAPSDYVERLEWLSSDERALLVVGPITEHTTAILKAAMNAKSNYEDIIPIQWTSKSGEEFTCKMRFWRTASHDWTYIVDLCFDKTGALDEQATREKNRGSVHVMHYDDENRATKSIVTTDYSFEDFRFTSISTESGRTCYRQSCGDDYEVASAKDVRNIELEAVEQLLRS